jgi:hypothetical protein
MRCLLLAVGASGLPSTVLELASRGGRVCGAKLLVRFWGHIDPFAVIEFVFRDGFIGPGV